MSCIFALTYLNIFIHISTIFVFSKNAGLEQKLQNMESQLKENNKTMELSSSTSLTQANEIKTLSDAVIATKKQLKELIEDKMHSALVSQLQEKQKLTDQLMEVCWFVYLCVYVYG